MFGDSVCLPLMSEPMKINKNLFSSSSLMFTIWNADTPIRSLSVAVLCLPVESLILVNGGRQTGFVFNIMQREIGIVRCDDCLYSRSAAFIERRSAVQFKTLFGIVRQRLFPDTVSLLILFRFLKTLCGSGKYSYNVVYGFV